MIIGLVETFQLGEYPIRQTGQRMEAHWRPTGTGTFLRSAVHDSLPDPSTGGTRAGYF